MRYLPIPFLVLFTTSGVAAWLPSCGWNDCMNGWTALGCSAGSGWKCLCKNATAIAQINTCVATSCTNTTDQEAIYGAMAQLCVNNGVRVTNSQQATFSVTSGGSLSPTITSGPGWGPGGHWGAGDWSAWVSAFSSAVGTAPPGWNGGPWGGWRTGDWTNGPWTGGSWTGGPWYGPWATKASGVACSHWTTWTAGWGPYSAWTGTWSGCSTTTATPSPATVTRTVTANGSVATLTGTTFGVQAQAAQATDTANAAATTNPAALGIAGGAAVAIFGLMVAL